MTRSRSCGVGRGIVGLRDTSAGGTLCQPGHGGELSQESNARLFSFNNRAKSAGHLLPGLTSKSVPSASKVSPRLRARWSSCDGLISAKHTAVPVFQAQQCNKPHLYWSK